MKTTTKKTFDAVQFMRDQREKLSEKLSKMTKEGLLSISEGRNWKVQQSQVHDK
jgi:hypothetical protein